MQIDDLFSQRTPLNKRRIHNVDELMAPQLSYKEELSKSQTHMTQS